MRSTLCQRFGSGIALLGLTLLATAGALTVAGPASAAEQTSPVCNQLQAGENPDNCDGESAYGQVTWDVTGGQLVLRVKAKENYGWADVRVCAPYGPPANGADCQPNDGTLIPTTAYTLAMVVPSSPAATGDGKTYDFASCASEFVITVPMSAIPGDHSDWWWALHLNPAGGCGRAGTDEAFGHRTASSTTSTTVVDETTTTTTAGSSTTSSTAPTTTTTTARAAAPVEPQVLGAELEQNPAVAQPLVVGGTLPRTGAGTAPLLALAALALFLGGIGIRLGRPAAAER